MIGIMGSILGLLINFLKPPVNTEQRCHFRRPVVCSECQLSRALTSAGSSLERPARGRQRLTDAEDRGREGGRENERESRRATTINSCCLEFRVVLEKQPSRASETHFEHKTWASGKT